MARPPAFESPSPSTSPTPDSLTDESPAMPSAKKRSLAELHHLEGHFQNARDQSLFYFALFPPAKRVMSGVVLFLHGSGDHCRRYLELYEALCAAGFGVISYDFVNHGASDCDSHRTRAHVRSFRHLVEDTNIFLTFAKNALFPHIKAPSRVGNLPLIISAFSFGTLVGMHVVLSGRHKFHAAFWSSATVGVEMRPGWKVQALVVQPLSLFTPRARVVSPLDYEMLWRDPGCFEDFDADELATKSEITARTGQQTLSAMSRLDHAKAVEQPGSGFCALPMLFLSGSEDHIADQTVTRHFFNRLASDDKEFKVFEGVFHCIFEDPERYKIVEYLLHWLRRRCPKVHASAV